MSYYRSQLISLFVTLCSGVAFTDDQAPGSETEAAAIQDAELPEMAAITDVRTKKDTFFSFLEPIVDEINLKIEAERAWLKVIQNELRAGRSLNSWQRNMLETMGDYYKVDDPVGSNAFFSEMFDRVDVLLRGRGSTFTASEAGEDHLHLLGKILTGVEISRFC